MSPSKTLPAHRKTVIHNVRVFDSCTGNLGASQTVVIDGDVIGSSTEGADETVDGQGGVLLPGLIDAHVHLHHEGHLRALAKHGVTTALDMATWPAEKMNGLRARAGLPDILSAGLPATAPGSIHSHILPLPEEAMLRGPDGADAFVEHRIQEGSDYIKLIADVPGPSQATLDALTRAAHEKQKMVVVHASASTPFKMALDAKADIITHAPRDRCVDAELVERMKADGIVSVPTLVMMQEISKRPPMSAMLGLLRSPSLFMALVRSNRSAEGKQQYEHAKESVAMMHRAGVPILAGTDCHEEPGTFVNVQHGESLHRELQLLVEAGLSNVEALRAATVLAAEHFGFRDRGIVKEGNRADLVLLRDDPTQDIRATRAIERVWCAGVPFVL
ncbi:putative hydrolase [Acaromyces ingoldii]|uniref:Putative hydrolase n=1 Tax=Acaromyces ingoldii TaxID=215250 RepID=A0A316YDQ2_9BASI|nr:putative hydrolase [Acaromyces ingoldii]PWN86788.1 putative hydrolase [Acaromyces ingoldii]